MGLKIECFEGIPREYQEKVLEVIREEGVSMGEMVNSVMSLWPLVLHYGVARTIVRKREEIIEMVDSHRSKLLRLEVFMSELRKAS